MEEALGADVRGQLMGLLEAGVPVDKFDAYLALAGVYAGEGDFSAGLSAALDAFPLPVPAESVPRIVASAVGVEGAGAAWGRMSLLERGALFRQNPEKAREMAAEAGEALAE